MKSGSFRAVGYEGQLLSDPKFYFPVLGVLQFLLVLLISAQPSFHELLYPLFYPSALLMLISFVVLVVFRLKGSPTGTYEVSFLDRRDEGGKLEVTYVNAKGLRRTSAEVKSVDPDPRGPLYRGFRFPIPVAGTRASLTIELARPRVALSLGFPSLEEMENVYGQLK